MDFIVKTNVHMTDANDFRGKVSETELDNAKPMLMSLIEVDPRGACFRQSDLAAATEKALSQAGKMAGLAEATRVLQCEPAEACALTAYKMRIILAAARNQCSPFDHADFFAAMSKVAASGISAAAEQRQRRLAARPHPFVCFRTEEETNHDDDDEEGEAEVVATFFDGTAALKMFANGEKALADQYLPGDDGFVKAYWANDKSTMTLELPNKLLKDGKLLSSDYDTAAAMPAVLEPKGKAKAKGKAASTGTAKATAKAPRKAKASTTQTTKQKLKVK